MLEHIRRVAQGWLGKTILAAVTIPFALFGIDFYLNQAGQNVSVAQVNGQKISIQEYTTALQDWRNRIRATGKVQNVDLDAPIFKRLVLNRLVDERLLAQSLQHSGLVMSDAELSRTILQMKEFQKNGQFSQELYDQTLQQNGLTPSKFEARLRRDLLLSELQGGLVNLAQSTQTQQQTSQDLLLQKREVSIASIKASDFLTAAQVGESEVQAFYDKNHEKFRVPEQVKIEFLLLSVNEFLPQVKVDETEVKKAFDDNADKMQGNEERRASHILLAFPKDDAKQKAIARTKAEALLAVLQSDPAQFEALAQKNSQDPGSASKGGDLGRFGRGAMVKPFEDAVFQMKVGQISHLVESEFGYHIIKLTEVSGSRPDFSSLKAQIKADLLLQKAQALFAERAENFNDMVYQQSTSLQPTAKAFGLQVQASDWLSRQSATELFKTKELVEQIFAPETLKDGRNTNAVEVSPNHLMAARVVAYQPSKIRPFAEVKMGILEFLKQEAAFKLAVHQGEASLQALKSGKPIPNKLSWAPAVTISRTDTQSLQEAVAKLAFRVSTNTLPAYTGSANDRQGYVLLKLLKVIPAEAVSGDDKSFNNTLQDAYLAAYMQSLRDKGKVKINSAALQ